ncbi:MAG TPA: hypothetical protein VFA20_25325 [Myxococcaceae bacterium]|nr:hypothetical protein [Myxococcaceae bacterium]
MSAVLAVLVFAMAAEPPPEVKAYEEATADLEKVDAAIGSRLEKWLSSENPYQRQAVLLRYQTARGALAPSAADALLRLLDDQDKRVIGPCVYLVFHDPAEGTLGEGQYEELDRCQQNQRSNAELAAELLPALGHAQGLCAKVVAAVVQKPQRGTLLTPAARAACSADELLGAAAPQAPTPAAQQALLRLFLATGAAPDDSLLLPLMNLPELRTRELVALALLRAPKLPGEALALLMASIDDDQRDDVLRDLPQVGEAAAPLGPALIRRLSRPQAVNPIATLQAVAALRKLPPDGAKPLGRALEGDLADHAFRTVAALEPADAKRVRPQVLKAAQGKRRDLSLALRALQAAESPVSAAEFRLLDRIYQRGCLTPPVSYHDDPNEPWCADAEKAMAEIALEGGFKFHHLSVY